MTYDTDILEFKGEWEFLSNFHRQSFRYKSIFWPTSEHAYQAMKVFRGSMMSYREDLAIAWKSVFPQIKMPNLVSEGIFMRGFARITSPGQAKRAGKYVPLNPNWHLIRRDVMLDVIRHKFASGTPIAHRLLSTFPRHLEEGNWHGDDYWGVDLRKGTGENHLGKILMQVREELYKQASLQAHLPLGD